jgi:hypothetical protein
MEQVICVGLTTVVEPPPQPRLTVQPTAGDGVRVESMAARLPLAARPEGVEPSPVRYGLSSSPPGPD